MNEDLDKLITEINTQMEVLTKFETRFTNDIEAFVKANYINLDNYDFSNLQSELEFHFSELMYWRKRKYEAFKQIKNGLKTLTNEEK